MRRIKAIVLVRLTSTLQKDHREIPAGLPNTTVRLG